jgi:outer membrane receptor protein involved in Fe transport
VNSVDLASQPRMNWSFTLTHLIGRFQTNLLITYKTPIKDSTTLTGLDQCGCAVGSAAYNTLAASGTSISRNIWPGPLYYNLAFAYDIYGREDDKKLQLYLNINNVMNKQPPLIATSLGGVVYDMIGRNFRTGIRFAF